MRLIKRGRFRPLESLELGLLHDPDLAVSVRDNISKRELSAVQNRLNQVHWFYITEDKSIFYRLCDLHRIPHPRVRALLYRSSSGWSESGLVLNSSAAWAQCLGALHPDELIVKPTRGRHGMHVYRLSRDQAGTWYLNEQGRDIHDIAELLWNERGCGAWLVQDRLRLHPSLAELTGTDAVQTLRAGTYVSPGGRVMLLNVALRMIAAGNRTDNFLYGRTGNVLGLVDPATGEVSRTFGAKPGGIGYLPVPEHPDTGRVLIGWRVPDWDRVRGLLADLARMVLPLRTIGWDIAITPDGPVVIEGNFRYDPPITGSLIPEARKLLDEGGEPEGGMLDRIIG